MRITFVASVSSTSYHQQQQEQEQQREQQQQQQQQQQHDDDDNNNNHNDSSSLSILEEIVNIAMDAAITKLNDIELAKTIQYGKDNIIIKQMNSNQNHIQQQQQQQMINNNNNYDDNNHHKFIMSLYQISQDLLQLNQKKKSSSSLPSSLSSENENEQIALQILHSLADTAQHIPSYVSLGTIYYDKYQRTRGAHEPIPEEEDEINDEQDDDYYLKRSLDYFLLADEHHSDGGHQASLYNAGRIYLEMNMFPHAVAYIRAAAVFQYNDNNDNNNKKKEMKKDNNNNGVQISDLTRTCRNAYETLLSQLSRKISSTLSIEEIADIFMYSSKLPSLSILSTNEQSSNDNNNNNSQKNDDDDFPQAGSIEAQLFTNGILSMKQYYDNNDSTPNNNSKTNIDLLSVAVTKFRTLWETDDDDDDDDEDTTTTTMTTNKQQRIMSSLQIHILLSLINECYNELLKLMMHNNNNDNIDNDDDHKKTELLLMAAKYSETLATSSTYCYNDMYNINTTDQSKFHHDHKNNNNNNLIMNMRKRRMEKQYREVEEGDNDYNNGCFNYAISNAIHLYRQYYSTKNNNNNDSNHNDDDHIRRVMNIANNHPKSSSSTITFSDDGTPTTTTSSWIDDLNQ